MSSLAKQTSCLWLASCPQGSSSASKFGLVIFVIVLIIGSCIVFWIHGRFEAVRTHHLEKRLRWIHNHNTNNDSILLNDNEEVDADKSPGASTTELTTKESVIEIEASSDKQGNRDEAEIQASKKKKWNKVSQTFDIEFEHLGLTLSNGTPILRVGQRQIHETVKRKSTQVPF